MRAPVNSSAVHVFEVLRIICASDEPVGGTEIARRLSLPITTVHRALITLEEAQYISRYQNSSRYEPGLMSHLLLWTHLRCFPIGGVAMPLLRRLAQTTGETVSLCVRVGWYALRVATVYGTNDIYHRDRLGEMKLLHDGLSQQAIFAFLSEQEHAQYRSFLNLHHRDAALEFHRGNSRRVVAAAHADGYVMEEAPLAPGRYAVAFAVRDAHGSPIASIMINGPVLGRGDISNPRSVKAWLAVRDELETIIRAEPERFRPRYGHIAPDNIVIALAETPAP